jgi:hypothetical protein
MSSISYKRIIIVTIMAYLVIAIELFFLTSYRLLYLPHAMEVLCSDDMSTYTVCANEVIKIMLFGAQWNAVKFTVYVATLTLLFFTSFRRCGSMVGIHMLAACVLTLFIVFASISPAWVEVAAVITAALLSGSYIARRLQALKIKTDLKVM